MSADGLTRTHPQTRVTTCFHDDGGISIDVDTAMAPLLLEIWAWGLKTNFSCQGEAGDISSNFWPAYIAFDGYEAAVKFAARTWDLTGIGIDVEATKHDGSGVVRFKPSQLQAITEGWMK